MGSFLSDAELSWAELGGISLTTCQVYQGLVRLIWSDLIWSGLVCALAWWWWADDREAWASRI